MMNFFKCKIRYEKITETGVQRMVTEEYLVDSLSFTEAEKRIIEEMQAFISGEFSVSDISRFKVTEAFLSETGDRYYKAKLYFLTLDEKSATEKKTAVNMLVRADDIEAAKEIIVSEMKKSMVDYTIQKIEETRLIDVFPYSEK